MRNSFLSILFFTLLGCSSTTCEEFKTGRFGYQEKPGDIVIERFETKQFERSKSEGFEDEYKIIWKNDCEYQLVLMKTNDSFEAMRPKLDTMTVRITETGEKGYNFMAFLNDTTFNGTLFKHD